MRTRFIHFATLTVVALALAATGVFGTHAGAAQPPVGLGTASSFAVLAGSTITNTGPSVISGDIGLSPGTAITGFPPGVNTNGTIHATDAVAAQAKADLTTAYNDAAGRSVTATVTADLAGQTLTPGVYAGPTLALNGRLTLDAKGDPNAVFIFQAGSTLITGSSSDVLLIGGADPCNVVWQVGSSATLGTNSHFVGSILALTSIAANTNATITGRLLARNAAVTLDTNTINRPNCAGPTTTTTAPATTTTQPATTTTQPTTTTTTMPSTGTGGGGGSSSTGGGGGSSSTGGGGGSTGATTGTTGATTTTQPTTTTTTTMPSTGTGGGGGSSSTGGGGGSTGATTGTTGATTSTTTTTVVSTGTSGTGGSTGTTTGSTGATTGTTGTAVSTGTATGGGGGSATATAGTTTSLARTGSHITAGALIGLLALILGGFLILASRRPTADPRLARRQED